MATSGSFTPPYPGPKEVTYLFVDAGCLREAVKAASIKYIGIEGQLNINWQSLRGDCDKVFYYDAVDALGHKESDADWHDRIQPRMDELRQIRLLDGYHVPLGDLRGKRSRQKKVDVMIAVDMLMHTVRRNMHRCILLAGDVDFQPLIEALVREGMSVTIWHPENASDDLVGAADSSKLLGGFDLANKLLRLDGSALLPIFQSAIRPKDNGIVKESWESNRHKIEVRERNDDWLIEYFDPKAYATSMHFSDKSLYALLAFAEEKWPISLSDAAQKLKSDAALELKKL